MDIRHCSRERYAQYPSLSYTFDEVKEKFPDSILVEIITNDSSEKYNYKLPMGARQLMRVSIGMRTFNLVLVNRDQIKAGKRLFVEITEAYNAL